MDKRLKKITDANFKANADLQVQYIFNDGYCYFNKSQAESRKATVKENYSTVKRDTKAEEANANKAAELEQLNEELTAAKQLLLDATGESEKNELQATIDELEKQIEALQ